MPLLKCKDNDYVYMYTCLLLIYIQGVGYLIELYTDMISVDLQTVQGEDARLYRKEGHVYGGWQRPGTVGMCGVRGLSAGEDAALVRYVRKKSSGQIC